MSWWSFDSIRKLREEISNAGNGMLAISSHHEEGWVILCGLNGTLFVMISGSWKSFLQSSGWIFSCKKIKSDLKKSKAVSKNQPPSRVY